jgi:hypothetical protein
MAGYTMDDDTSRTAKTSNAPALCPFITLLSSVLLDALLKKLVQEPKKEGNAQRISCMRVLSYGYLLFMVKRVQAKMVKNEKK